MTLLVGLTGSIGMGKSTTAAMFSDAGIPVWDADAAVHRLYAKGGAAIAPMSTAFPSAVIDGAVDRSALKTLISADSSVLKDIEAIVHPLVAADRQAFIDANQTAPMIILDMPLLFETGADAWLDRVVVVTAPPDVQKTRVMDRPGMTEAQFRLILSKQMPDAEKRVRADHILETRTLDATRLAVHSLIDELRTTNGRT